MQRKPECAFIRMVRATNSRSSCSTRDNGGKFHSISSRGWRSCKSSMDETGDEFVKCSLEDSESRAADRKEAGFFPARRRRQAAFTLLGWVYALSLFFLS